MSKSEQYTPRQANIFRRHPVVNRPPKRHTDARRGQEFTPHGTDSVGVIVSDPQRNRRSVQFRYRHDPDVLHTMDAREFHDRFCTLGARAPRTLKVRLHIDTKKYTDAMHAAATSMRNGLSRAEAVEGVRAAVRDAISVERTAA